MPRPEKCCPFPGGRALKCAQRTHNTPFCARCKCECHMLPVESPMEEPHPVDPKDIPAERK